MPASCTQGSCWPLKDTDVCYRPHTASGGVIYMILLKMKCGVYGKIGLMSEIFSILSRNNNDNKNNFRY